jgi:hypothetical protein
MAVILESSDSDLMRGLSADRIFEIANSRQNRIQRGNLTKVLDKFEELQVDEDGRGLVLSYNEATGEVSVVDRQLLLYRRYATVKWPWEEMINEADRTGTGFGSDGHQLAPFDLNNEIRPPCKSLKTNVRIGWGTACSGLSLPFPRFLLAFLRSSAIRCARW